MTTAPYPSGQGRPQGSLQTASPRRARSLESDLATEFRAQGIRQADALARMTAESYGEIQRGESGIPWEDLKRELHPSDAG
jgi:hypothetical protein